MSKLVVEEIDLQQCNDFWEIEKQCFSDPWSFLDFEYQIKNPNTEIIGAFVGNMPVGFVNLQCVAGELTINNIAVLKEFRKQSIGEKLLKAALEAYPNADVAFLEVRESNIPAQKLYEKFGFVKVGERKNYYQNPTENAMLMTKNMKTEQYNEL